MASDKPFMPVLSYQTSRRYNAIKALQKAEPEPAHSMLEFEHTFKEVSVMSAKSAVRTKPAGHDPV